MTQATLPLVRQSIPRRPGIYEWGARAPDGTKVVCFYLGKAGGWVGGWVQQQQLLVCTIVHRMLFTFSVADKVTSTGEEGATTHNPIHLGLQVEPSGITQYECHAVHPAVDPACQSVKRFFT